MSWYLSIAHSYWISTSVGHMNYFCMCVWGMGIIRIVFNIETGNYYSKSTFIVTLIKQEKLVSMLVILYIQEYLCVLTKLFTGTQVSVYFQFGYPVPKITEN